MKIVFIGSFDEDDLKIINEIVKQQQTTNREIETTTFLCEGITHKIIVKKLIAKDGYTYNNTFVDKIIFRKL